MLDVPNVPPALGRGHPVSDVLLKVTVPGVPRTQGSAKLVHSQSTGRPIMKKPDGEVEHRRKVAAMSRNAWQTGLGHTGPVAVLIIATFPRPKHHYGTGGNAHLLKPSAPDEHAQKPDADKVARLVCDALVEGRCIADDAQIAELAVEKQWGDVAATTIQVWAL